MAEVAASTSNGVGLLNESPLHASLKRWYGEPGDRFEVPVDGYVIDVVRGDLLIEIQTGAFYPLRDKLRALVADHPVRLVHPIAVDRTLVKVDDQGDEQDRRLSPKHGDVTDLFSPLVSMPDLIEHPRFELEVLLTVEEEIRRYDGKKGRRRKGWVVEDRRLVEVLDRRRFCDVADLVDLVPGELRTEPFTTADLAEALHRPRRLAQQMAYCLRSIDAIAITGKSGNALIYGVEPPG